MGGPVVVLVEEGPESDIDVVERGEAAEEVDAALAKRAPEPLHFSAGLWVVGTGVEQRDAESGAGGGERVSAVRRAVVQVERVGLSVTAQRPDEQAQHVDFPPMVVRLKRAEQVRSRGAKSCARALIASDDFEVLDDRESPEVEDVAARASVAGLRAL